MAESTVYRFEDWVLDGPNRRLTRHGVETCLPPKTYETLLVLVQHHGQLVTKAALLDAVWSDTAVTENALTQQISDLREALGDNARQPRFIRTIPRVGFTFIAPVEGGRANGDGETERLPLERATQGRAESLLPESSLRRIRAAAGPALALLTVIVAAGSAWLAMRSGRPLEWLELVSGLPGLYRSPSLSPDGRTVAFVGDRSGTSQIWVKALAGGDPLQLTFHDRPVARPRWTPDGHRIIYSVDGDGIWSVASLGGSPRQLVEHGWNPDISPDGRALVFERRWEIWTSKADGTEPRELPTFKQGYLAYYGDAWPTFSPDGKQIALFLGEKGQHGDYWVVSSSGSEPRRLSFDVAEGGAPAWTPDGKYIVVSSARAGSLTLWRIPAAGGNPEPLTTGAGEDVDPAVSTDGRRIVFTNVKRSWSLVIHDTHTGTRRVLRETRTSMGFPRFSWDGRSVAFFGKDETGDTHVFVADSNGGHVRPVTAGRGELNVMPQWASDGRSLFYYQVRPRAAFRRIAVTGGPPEEVAEWRWDRELEASSDPSSDRIAYAVLEGGRLRETRVRRLGDSAETTLATPLFGPQFSRDGRLIAGESRDHEVTLCEIGGACRALTPKLEHGLASIAWSGDGTRIFYLARAAKADWGELKSISVDGTGGQAHGSFGPVPSYMLSIGVSPRDQIVFAPYREGPHELWIARLR